MRRRPSLTLGVVSLMLMLGAERSWAGPPDPTHSDSLGNTAGGTGALSNNTTGKDNTAFGDNALLGNTTGLFNTATGFEALKLNVTGGNNTAMGLVALTANSIGSENTAVGSQALDHNDTGNSNTAIGVSALASNTSGSANTASGAGALTFNVADNNTATGAGALENNTTGGSNTAMGFKALQNNNIGSGNTAIGSGALSAVQEAGLRRDANTAIGFETLAALFDGFDNTAVGPEAGVNLGAGDNNVYLANPGQLIESNTMRLGGGFQFSTFIAGVAGVTVDNGAPVLINTATGQLGTLNSSARYKRDIAPMGAQSRGLFQLRPVTFSYKQDTQGERQYGLIAEQVAKVYPELVTRNAAGEVEAVRYHELIPMLLNEVQQQQRQLASLKATVKQLQERDSVMTARLERLEVAASQTTTLASR